MFDSIIQREEITVSNNKKESGVILMQVVSAEQKKKVLEVLEVAIQVGTPLQIGRLWGIGEQMARGHEEEQSRKKAGRQQE